MIEHQVRVQKPGERLPRSQQLAWKIAEVAASRVPLDPAVTDLIGSRIIDNAAVAVAALGRPPVTAARAMALAHPRPAGATVMGLPQSRRVDCEWAAWANGTAVRELDFHDTFLAAEYAHPADSIPPLIAVAQQCRRSGADLLQGIATAYEIHVALARGICLHRHKIDHVAHLGPAVAAGLGALLELPPEITYQAVGQALHTTCATRQSRKGEISSWKAFAPAFAGKVAIEAVDRALRGERSPSPIYEGTDAVIASLLDGPGASYSVRLPAPGEPRRASLSTFTKAHSAEYQAQAIIDLAFDLGAQLAARIGDDYGRVDSVLLHTSHHTHHVIGSGAGDPEKLCPAASRETLDHSIAYIIAVALQDRSWHSERSYAPERARRPDTVALWRKVRTVEDPAWTERYHAAEPEHRAFGGRLVITLADGSELAGELAVAHAHPAGAHPLGRADYLAKLHTLANGLASSEELARFVELVERLPELSAREVGELNVAVADERLLPAGDRGLF